MPYATVYQVAARNAARGTYTATSIPNASQVLEYINEAAAQLDQWLYAGGYAAPFDKTIASGMVATTGQLLLQRWNVTGAALYVEQAAQMPINRDEFEKAWTEVKAVILDKTVDIPLPISPAKQNPRAPGVPGSLGDARGPEFIFDMTANVRNHQWDL